MRYAQTKETAQRKDARSLTTRACAACVCLVIVCACIAFLGTSGRAALPGTGAQESVHAGQVLKGGMSAPSEEDGVATGVATTTAAPAAAPTAASTTAAPAASAAAPTAASTAAPTGTSKSIIARANNTAALSANPKTSSEDPVLAAEIKTLASMITVRKNGRVVPLSTLPKDDYAGFIVEAADTTAADHAFSSAVDSGAATQINNTTYILDTLEDVAQYTDPNHIAFIEPDYFMHLDEIEGEGSSITLGNTTGDNTTDTTYTGGTAGNPAPGWPPNDPYYASGYQDAKGTTWPGQWNLTLLEVKRAWERGLAGGNFNLNGQSVRIDDQGKVNPVRVAVIDTGLFGTGSQSDMPHEDINYNNVEPGYNFLTNTIGDTADEYGHGTRVAGFIAAAADNSVGIAGIAPDAVIVPLKVSDTRTGITTSSVVRAIAYAVDVAHVDVINISIGDSVENQTLHTACTYAHDNGVIIVASAGNEGSATANYPAAFDEVVGVGFVTSSKQHDNFSNYGVHNVCVVAPGRNVLTLNNQAGLSGYMLATGSSFAAPQIAALAAQCKSVYPSMTHEVFVQMLADNAQDIGDAGQDDYYGYGLADVGATASAAIDSQIRPWYNVSFDVQSATGAHIEGAQVKVYANEDIQWEARSDVAPVFDAGTLTKDTLVQPQSDSTYLLHCGQYRYEITASGWYHVEGDFSTYDDTQTQTVVMQPAHLVMINVEDPLGSRLSNAQLVVTNGSYEEQPLFPAQGTAEGIFIYDLANGTYTYTLSSEGYETVQGMFYVNDANVTITTLLCRPDQVTDVDLVFRGEDGQTIDSKDLDITVLNGSGATVKPQADGHYRLATGRTYGLKVHKLGYQDLQTSFTVVDQGNHVEHLVLLLEYNSAQFVVVDEAGVAIKDATVLVHHNNGERVTPHADNPYLYNLPMDTYVYEVHAKGYISTAGSFVVSGETNEITVTLQHSAQSVRLNVQDDQGISIANSHVRVTYESGADQGGTDQGDADQKDTNNNAANNTSGGNSAVSNDAGSNDATNNDDARQTTGLTLAQELPMRADGTWRLEPGAYSYVAYAEGYEAVRGTFRVRVGHAIEQAVVLPKASESQVFAGGSGTATDPYLIATETQLRALADQTQVTAADIAVGNQREIGGYYELLCDIDLQSHAWTPIGNRVDVQDGLAIYRAFSGVFQGNGYTIDNLNVSGGSLDYQGLFGYVKNAQIANVVVLGSVVGRNRVGGLVGALECTDQERHTTITNCGSNVNVAGQGGVGGICGYTQALSLDVTSVPVVGDVCGATIQSCYNAGNVAALEGSELSALSGTVGGICGHEYRMNIANCYNIGEVQGGFNVGGLVGNAQYGTVTSSYTAGTVSVYVQDTESVDNTKEYLVGRTAHAAFLNCAYRSEKGSFLESRACAHSEDSIFSQAGVNTTIGRTHKQMYREQVFVERLNNSDSQPAQDEDLNDSFVLGSSYPLLSWQVVGRSLLAPSVYINRQPQGNKPEQSYLVDSVPTLLSAAADEIPDGDLSWAWYESSYANGADSKLIDGATGEGVSARLVPYTDESHRGITYYYCVFTSYVSNEDTFDTASIRTNVVPVYVRRYDQAEAPEVTVVPQADSDGTLTFKMGVDGTLTAKAHVTDGGSLSYQWYTVTGNAINPLSKISGATDASYTVATDGSVSTCNLVVEVTNMREPGNFTSVTSDPIRVNVVDYTVETYDDLAQLRDIVNAGTSYEGQTVRLAADIDMQQAGCVDWTPIGTADHPFRGTFIGVDVSADTQDAAAVRTIRGLVVQGSNHGSRNLGLFGFVRGATLQNIVVGGKIVGTSNVFSGLLVGRLASSFESGASDSVIRNCGTLQGSSVEGAYALGGLVGASSASFENCVNHATVTAYPFATESLDDEVKTWQRIRAVGGIAGFVRFGNSQFLYNTGKVKVIARTDEQRAGQGGSWICPAAIGGVVGTCDENATLSHVFNVGTVTVPNDGGKADEYADDHSDTQGKVRFWASVVGFSANDDLTDLYYLRSTSERGTSNFADVDLATPHGLAFMKTEWFAYLMNGEDCEPFAVYDENFESYYKNGGHIPYLLWEDDPTTLDVDDGKVYTAEPVYEQVRSTVFPALSSTGMGSCYQGTPGGDITTYFATYDGGNLTCYWERRTTELGSDWETVAIDTADGRPDSYMSIPFTYTMDTAHEGVYQIRARVVSCLEVPGASTAQALSPVFTITVLAPTALMQAQRAIAALPDATTITIAPAHVQAVEAAQNAVEALEAADAALLTDDEKAALQAAIDGLAAARAATQTLDELAKLCVGDPAGDDPLGDDPAGDDPAGDDQSGGDPAGDDPSGDDPSKSALASIPLEHAQKARELLDRLDDAAQMHLTDEQKQQLDAITPLVADAEHRFHLREQALQALASLEDLGNITSGNVDEAAQILDSITTDQLAVLDDATKAVIQAISQQVAEATAAKAIVNQLEALQPITAANVAQANELLESLTPEQRAMLSADDEATLAAASKAADAANIIANAVPIANAHVTVASCTYTGAALTPAISVKYNGRTLREGSDYRIERFQRNVNAGTGTVTIAGIGAFKETTTANFTIAKAANPVSVKAKYLKAKKGKKVTFKAGKVWKIANNKGGKITYKAKKNKKAKKIKIKQNGTVIVKKGQKKGTYKFKVTISVAGNANYNPASRTVTLKIRVK